MCRHLCVCYMVHHLSFPTGGFKSFLLSLVLSNWIMIFLVIVFFIFLVLRFVELESVGSQLSSNLEKFRLFFLNILSGSPFLPSLLRTSVTYVFNLLKLSHSSLAPCSFFKVCLFVYFEYGDYQRERRVEGGRRRFGGINGGGRGLGLGW